MVSPKKKKKKEEDNYNNERFCFFEKEWERWFEPWFCL